MSFDSRADAYDNLKWVSMMDEFVEMCEPKPDDIVCDVGAGTGAVTHALLGKVKSIVAVDTSFKMLDKIKDDDKISKIHQDAFSYLLKHKNEFDLITCRMSLHHMMDDHLMTAVLCHDALKDGGRIVVAEGVYPRGCRGWYSDVFHIKEPGRYIYSPSDLICNLRVYKDIEMKVIKQRDMSMTNWLYNSDTNPHVTRQIGRMHTLAPGYVKEAYNMRDDGEDIIMDWEQCIVKGYKW